MSQDPFEAIKQAVLSALGYRCGLITQGICLFSELFCSTYEQLSLCFLETKDFMKNHVSAFIAKKKTRLMTADFTESGDVPVIVIGKGESLKQDLEFLKKNQQHALIVAAYSVLPFLDQNGIVVDLAYAFDPNQPLHAASNAKFLMVSAKANFAIMQNFRSICLFPESFCEFSNYIFQNHPHAPVYGYTVIDLAIKHLIQKGFKNFYLSGVDLRESDGMYVDNTACGFKPDFKKAKEHLDTIASSGINIKPLTSLDRSIVNKASRQPLVKAFEGQDFFEQFESSLEKLKKLDFQKLGLYEMFELENEPFYRVVLEPLYEKLKLLNHASTSDKRAFFKEIIGQYN